MFSPSRLKTLHPLQVFSVKSSSALSSMKLKNLIHTLIVSHVCRIIRALSKVKNLILEILKDNHSYPSSQKKHCSKISKKIIMGSFRLHYNWCSSKSSHVLPVPARVYQGLQEDSAAHLCYDSNWNTTTATPAEQQQAGEDCPDSQLAGYLQWLEESVHDDDDGEDVISSTTNNYEKEINKIDMLAEMFIANCHEKFRLEKQESDRKFQEMLARSL